MAATAPVSVVEHHPTVFAPNDYSDADTVAVDESDFTDVPCPLRHATFVQVYIRPTSTQQIYTVRLPNDHDIELAAGQTFAFRVPDQIGLGDTVFSVQTADSAAVLQVVAFRERLYPRALGVS